ncbi:MAG: DUF4262 domain-containing protein [Pseudomonadales bacterium]|jgi:hypothetical protein|nr:DUF4262 domain-containing protein [Pseudomonadales bacterium]
MDPADQKALDDIAEYGCHIIHVLEEDDLPGFSYSIGIQEREGQPELIVTGLNRDLAHWIINEYNHRVRAGERFSTEAFYEGFLEGFDVTFRRVEKEHFHEHFGRGIWLYDGLEFEVLQLIYPSTSGVWPWEEEASDEYKWGIPALYAS